MAVFYVRSTGGGLNSASTYTLTADSSGAAGTGVPGSADDVVFLAGSGNVTASATQTVNSIVWDARNGTATGLLTLNAITVTVRTALDATGAGATATVITATSATARLDCSSTVAGTYQAKFLPGQGITGTLGWYMRFPGSAGSWDLTPPDSSVLSVAVQFPSNASTLRLTRGFATTGTLQHQTAGTFDTGNFDIKCAAFLAVTNTTARTLNLGTSTITLTGTGNVWDLNTTNLTTLASQATIVIANTSLSAATFSSGGSTVSYKEVIYSAPGPLTLASALTCGIFRIQSSVAAVSTELVINAGCFLTCDEFYVVAFDRESRIMVRSSVMGTPRTITANNSVRLCDASFTDINMQGAGWATATGGPSLIEDPLTNRVGPLDDYRTPSGAAWQQVAVSEDWRTDAQGAYANGTGTNVLTLNGRTPDGTVAATVAVLGDQGAYLMARRTGSHSYTLHVTGTTVVLQRRIGTTTSVLNFSHAHVDGDRYALSCIGDEFIVYVNGIERGRVTDATSARRHTRWGLQIAGGTAGTARVRDFTFTPAVTPVPPQRVGDAQGNLNVPAGVMQDSRYLNSLGGNWNLAATWTLNGDAGYGPPLPQDDVAVSLSTTVNVPHMCRGISHGSSGDVVFNNDAKVYGYVLASSSAGQFRSGSGSVRTLELAGRGEHTIAGRGSSFGYSTRPMAIRQLAGTYTMQDSLSIPSGGLLVQPADLGATLVTQGHPITAANVNLVPTGSGSANVDWSATGTDVVVVGTGSVFTTSSISGRTAFVGGSKPRINATNASDVVKSVTVNRSSHPIARLTWAKDLDLVGNTGNSNTVDVLDVGPGRSLTFSPATDWTVGALSGSATHESPFYMGAAPLNSNAQTHVRGRANLTLPAATNLKNFWCSSLNFVNPVTIEDGYASNCANHTLVDQRYPHVRDVQSFWETRALTGGFTISVPRPAVQAGDVVVLVAQTGMITNPTTITADPPGFTRQYAHTVQNSVTWTKTVTDPAAEPASYTVSLSSTVATLHANALSAISVSNTAGLGVTSGAAFNASTSHPFNQVTTTGPDRMLLHVMAIIGANGQNASPGPGGIEVFDHVRSGTNSPLMAAYAVGQAVAGTSAVYTPTTSGSIASNRITLSFLPSAAGVVQQGAWDGTSTSTLTTTATVTTISGAALTATSTLIAGGTREATGAVTLSAASTLTAAGAVTQVGAAALQATSTLTATGTVEVSGTTSLGAASTLVAGGTREVSGAVAMTSASALTAVAVQIGKRLFDDFERPDGALGTAPTGQTWVVGQPAMRVLGGAAFPTDNQSLNSSAYADLGTTKQHIRWYPQQLHTVAQSTSFVTGARSASTSIGYLLSRQGDGTLVLFVMQINGTTPSLLVGYLIPEVLGGDLIELFIEDKVLYGRFTPVQGQQLFIPAYTFTSSTPGTGVAIGGRTTSAWPRDRNGALSIEAVELVPARADLAAASTLTAGGSVDVQGAVALSAISALAAEALVQTAGAVALASTSTLTSEAVLTRTATTDLATTSTLTTAGTAARQGALALSATSALQAEATVTGQGAVALASTSTLQAAATVARPGAVALQATSTLQTSAEVARPGAVQLASTSTLTAAGEAQAASGMALSAVSTLQVAGAVTAAGAVQLSSTSVLTAGGQRTSVAAAALQATSSLTVAGARTTHAVVALAATSALTAAGVRGAPGAVALTATSTLAAAGQRTSTGAVALQGTHELAVGVLLEVLGAVGLTAESSLVVEGQRTLTAAVVLLATAVLEATAAARPPASSSVLQQLALSERVVQLLSLAPRVEQTLDVRALSQSSQVLESN